MVEKEKITLFGRENISVASQRPHSLQQMFQQTVDAYRNKTALIFKEENITYEQFDHITSKIASHLQKQYGINKGDRIFSLIGNRLEFAYLMIASAKIGAVVIPANTKLTESEIAYIIGHSKPQLIVTEYDLLPVITSSKRNNPKIKQYAKTIISIDDPNPNTSFDSLMASNLDYVAPTINELDPAYILYTSGTTGRPKGAILSQINVLHTLIHYQIGFNLTENMRTMIAVPLFHVTGLAAQFLTMIYCGGSSVILQNYNNEQYILQSYTHKVNFHFNVPTIFIMMATSPLLEKYPFDFVELVAYGGSPIYLQTLEQLQRIFPNANYHNVYGATETSSPATMMPSSYPMSKASSVGKPVAFAEIKVINPETNEEAAVNKPGEIFIKGPMVIGEYLDNKEANAESFDSDGFWKSGDIGKIDEDGFIYVLDRMKDMINRGGEKIYSIEVEDVLKGHPDIKEAAVVATPDEIYGEKVKAIIVSDKTNEQFIKDVQQYCTRKLANYKVPEVFQFADELPKTASGKIMKHKL